MKRGLLPVGIQNDYFTGGAMQLVGMEKAAGRASALLQFQTLLPAVLQGPAHQLLEDLRRVPHVPGAGGPEDVSSSRLGKTLGLAHVDPHQLPALQ